MEKYGSFAFEVFKIKMPKVSIIIPTYNRADLLPRAINSVINQTYKDWELLVVDDGSTDNTKEIVEKFIKKDSRIKYFYKENGGQGSARNFGIKNAKGEYIAFLDSDDEWLPEKLDKQIEFMDKNKEYDFCYTADIIKDRNSSKEIIKKYSNDLNLSYIKLAGIGVGVPSPHIYRKENFEKVGLFDENRDLIGLEDNDWSVRGNFLKGFYLDEPVTIYYIHEKQITKQNINENIKKQIRGLKYILRKNFKIIFKNKKALLFRIAQIFHLELRYALRLYK